MKHINIALDGPAGAGKSTIAKEIAKKLNILYLDTGALYRSVGYFVKKSGLSLDEALKILQIDVIYNEKGQQTLVNSENVTLKIRSDEISKMASLVSKEAICREFLIDLQRKIAQKQSVIMDGRDIGTVILPNADVKIFLTASAEKRAKRRFLQENDCTYEEILQSIIQRDNQDENREIAPLKPADDAVILDTSDLNLEESIEKAYKIVSERV